MAALRAHLFDHRQLHDTTWITLYTVPTGKLIIVKSAVLVNEASAARRVLLAAAGTLTLSWPLGASGGADANYEWRPWMCVTEGQTVIGRLDGSGTVNVTLSGSLLFV